MQKIFFILVLCFYFPLKAQTSWDSLVIERHTWRSNFEKFTNPRLEEDVKVGTEKKVITTTKKINHWWQELYQFTDTTQLLTIFGIDTLQILQNPESLIAFYNGYNKHKINRNSQQKEFLIGLLGNTNIFKRELKNSIIDRSKYAIHRPYCYSYSIKFYAQSQLIAHYNSQKAANYKHFFPYINQEKKAVYNFQIDNLLAKAFRLQSFSSLKKGKKAIQYLVTRIIDANMDTLYKLFPYTYQTEIETLQTDFRLISFESVYQRSKFFGYTPNTIKVVLQSKEMLPNVYLNFIASTTKKGMYQANNLKKSYQNIVSRLQSIGFLRDYLLKDTTAKLDIYYFDNKIINDYVINEVNRSPEQWERYDDLKKRLILSTTDSIKRANQESLLAFYKLDNCACNYRWDKEFIEKAVVFTITDASNSISAWLLLPDDTLLLYRVDSRKIEATLVLKQPLTNFSPNATIPLPCLLLDKNGKLVPKN